MRSGIHGTFATMLLMIPVLSIPALAIFGIPQFAPVVASPLDENPRQDRERRVGKSARPTSDFMDDLEDAPEFGSEPVDRDSRNAPGRLGNRDVRTRNDHFNPDSRTKSRFKEMNTDSRSPWEDEPQDELPRDDDVGNRPAPKRFQDYPDDQPGNRLQGQPPIAELAPFDQEQDRRPRGKKTEQPKGFDRPSNSQPENGVDYRRSLETESLTWKEAVRRLNDLEIRNFRLQPGLHENQFAFSCMYTPSDNPRVSTRFEAEADEPLKAVEKVLAQIEVWQQRH